MGNTESSSFGVRSRRGETESENYHDVSGVTWDFGFERRDTPLNRNFSKDPQKFRSSTYFIIFF